MRTFTGEEFEDEVRRICRSLFSNSLGQGAEKVDGRERDGVFWSGSFFTIVEATTEKKKEKAITDGKKTHDLVSKIRSEGNMAQGYLVTLHEPTADQRLAVKRWDKTTKIISFDELRSLLFDASAYLRTRAGKPFGSIYDHVQQTFEVARSEFVSPTVINSESQIGGAISISELVQATMSSRRFVITAEYGVGKSMLLREVFFALATQFSLGNCFRFPLFINLREHLGQSDPVELLERHARSNAADPRKLVAAWSAGYVDLIIDGFDELSTRGWTGDHRKLREFRRSTHSVVKNLIRQTPRKSSVVISGRAAYFDSDSEMREALGTPVETFEHYSIQPFDADQAAEFLHRKGHEGDLPQWLPTRPLFLNYLINKGLIAEAVNVSAQGAFPEGAAWLALLRMIAERESEQSEGVDKDSILKFWGLLATKARQGNAIQKSFSPTEMDEVFYIATGNSVSEDERRLLLRLPGLGISPESATNRTFIDVDFLNAASAEMIAAHVRHPYGDEIYRQDLRNITQQLNQVGTHVLCSEIEQSGISTGLLEACLSKEMEEGNHKLAYDLFFPLAYLGGSKNYLTFEGIDIDELDICQDIWGNTNVDFSDCLISRLIIPPEGDLPAGLHFTECLIGQVEGRSSENDLPEDNFISCDVDKFSASYTVNNDILGSELALGVKVLVITLRKVYAQSGVSRLESALLRGLDHRARLLAPEVIRIMVKHGFLLESGRQGRTIYVGTRSMRKEALAIIQSPGSYKTALLEECRNLS
ncbi:NACHT domain-containing protein [Paenirhodobacter populi]|uniref:NACHT domain-containing protein n=1 Tax=Paenirhodobacter populi TaxID=2306993 RepID=A0A443J8M5_9RHOB|nr:NACHT domain-containing protein [Sinirhodobacter populi]RWR16830.1 NACHT domain-containing protein [Sinirhodobacter populi]